MVPDDWSEERLDALADLQRGISWSKADEVDPSEGEPVLSIPNIQRRGIDLSEVRHIAVDPDRARRYRGQPGSLVMVGSNGNPDRIGDCVQIPADQPFLFASFLLGLDPKKDLVDQDFFFWAVTGNELQRQIRGEVQGSTGLKNMSLRTVRSYRIPVPPLPEQQKIAAILSSVDDAIASTRKVIEQTKRVKKGLLQTLMTRGIGHTRFKKTEIGEIPEEWKVVSLEALGRAGVPAVRSGPFGSSLKTKHFTDSGRPVLTIQSLGEGEVEEDGLFFVSSEKAAELNEYEVESGDLVFSRVADIGRSVVIEKGADGWLISSNLIRISPDSVLVNSRYLMYSITGGGPVTRQIDRLAGDDGRPVVTSTMLKNLLFPVPPRDEQDQMVAQIRAVEDILSENRGVASRLAALKRGLMQDLLTGRVRVQPD